MVNDAYTMAYLQWFMTVNSWLLMGNDSGRWLLIVGDGSIYTGQHNQELPFNGLIQHSTAIVNRQKESQQGVLPYLL